MIPIMVTTVHRGVFFGYVDSLDDTQGETITLKDARNCLYWSRAVRGFLGLAATGPDKDCRIGPAVPKLTLRNITAVAEVNPAAAENWRAAPWGS